MRKMENSIGDSEQCKKLENYIVKSMEKQYNIYKYCDCFGNQGQKVAIVAFKN